MRMVPQRFSCAGSLPVKSRLNQTLKYLTHLKLRLDICEINQVCLQIGIMSLKSPLHILDGIENQMADCKERRRFSTFIDFALDQPERAHQFMDEFHVLFCIVVKIKLAGSRVKYGYSNHRLYLLMLLSSLKIPEFYNEIPAIIQKICRSKIRSFA